MCCLLPHEKYSLEISDNFQHVINTFLIPGFINNVSKLQRNYQINFTMDKPLILQNWRVIFFIYFEVYEPGNVKMDGLQLQTLRLP